MSDIINFSKALEEAHKIVTTRGLIDRIAKPLMRQLVVDVLAGGWEFDRDRPIGGWRDDYNYVTGLVWVAAYPLAAVIKHNLMKAPFSFSEEQALKFAITALKTTLRDYVKPSEEND
jgi:hypothetical protein